MTLVLLWLLVFGASSTYGLSVVYSGITTTDCGSVGTPDMLKVSKSLQAYELDVETTNSFIFEVKGFNDVGIYAMDSPNSQAANYSYRVYIGAFANTKIETDEIRDGEWFAREIQDGTYLNPNGFKPFWFSWANGEIQVGYGDVVGQFLILSWTDPNPFTVRGIGIGTCYGGNAEWKIKAEVADKFNGFFNNCQMFDTRSDLPVIASYISSEVHCAAECVKEQNCFGFNYQLTNERCELVSYGVEPVTGIMPIALGEWKFYAKCYDEDAVCVGCHF